MAKELKNQQNWQDLGLPDLRNVPQEHLRKAPDQLEKTRTVEDAITLLMEVFGFQTDTTKVKLETPLGPTTLQRESLEHIVEKRADARERFALFARATLSEPYEIWDVKYDDGSSRYAFIGVFEGKYQMLVVVTIWDGMAVWNFMHSVMKKMNRHRHGKLLFKAQ